MPRSTAVRIALCSLMGWAVLGGCSDEPVPTGPGSGDELALEVGPDGATASSTPTLTFWPFTGRTPSMSTPSDPINLIFLGEADPRDVRAALMALEGDRSPTFPPVFPFDCTWEDAMGSIQTAHEPSDGWTGSAIQLQCGTYDALRFHIRLFRQGAQTIANVHMDVLIPDTPTHDAISWEAAEQFVTFDVARTGLLGAAPGQTPQINPSPSYREIRAAVYNGLPSALRAFIGGPPGNVSAPVPMLTDGQATVLYLAGKAPRNAGTLRQRLQLQFGRVIPSPVCSTGPTDVVLVQGPVDLMGDFTQTGGGPFFSRFSVSGALTVTPIDISTGQPSGPSYRAKISERHTGQITNGVTSASSFISQTELPQGEAGRGRLVVEMRVAPGQAPKFIFREDC
jgi:hypothetical protein